jgi:hypothetical protein
MTATDRVRPRRPIERHRSLAGFYDADPRRTRSRELDVGLWWRERADGALHRAAWVIDTGELYVARLGPVDEGGGKVEVLARTHDRAHLERALRGWRDHCGQPGSLTWLRRRAAGVERRPDKPLASALVLSP